VLESLRRKPVAVSFSGGRDSSAVLAIATHVARRERLPDPVPVTLRYPGVAGADESGWQEAVVRHLGLQEWQQVTVPPGQLSFVGPVASRVLAANGLLWPPNSHLHDPLCAAVPGAALLTGFNGDRLFDAWRWRHVVPTLGRRAPDLRRLAGVGLRVAPTAVWARRERRRGTAPPWLDDVGRRQHARLSVEKVREPLLWSARLSWLAGRRETALVTEALNAVGAPYGVEVRHPLMDVRSLAGLARSGARRGWADRTSALSDLVGDLLPAAVVSRRSKAYFDEAVWTGVSAEHWQPTPALTDEARLSTRLREQPWDGRLAMPLLAARGVSLRS
jgi:hypothetical protein